MTPPEQAAVIALGYDGTCAQTCEEGWKQVMVGTLALYDSGGEPLETLHLANAPEDGKTTFFARMDREVATLKARCPDALWVGVFPRHGARAMKKLCASGLMMRTLLLATARVR